MAAKKLTTAGEIITWNAKSEKDHTYQEVCQALDKVGLDSGIVNEFLPRNAFSRACKTLAKDRVIDLFKQEASELVFQFTAKQLQEHGIEYSKETFVRLNVETGKITCENSEIQELAQTKLDEAMETRTTSDITRIVQKLFDEHGDLFPIRDQGGAYFVPHEHRAFINKIDEFLTNIGGSLRRFQVAGGPESNKAIQETIAEQLKSVIQDHKNAVADFSLNTRQQTLESAAVKINTTRTKVEAYASYLKDQADDLMKEVEAANAKLKQQVDALSSQRAKAPVVDKDTSAICGHAMTAVIRWMAQQGWTRDEVKGVLIDQLKVKVSDGTISTQMGRAKKRAGAELAKEQASKLERMRKKVKS